MGISFASASSQYLENTTLLPEAYPFTIGLWARFGAVGSVYSHLQAGQQEQLVYTDGTNWILFDGAGAAAGLVSAGRWDYLVIRYISDTNRRLATLSGAGVIAHAQSTTNLAMVSAAPTMRLGSRNNGAPGLYFDGTLAEVFVTHSDIQPDGGELNATLLRQLAYRGPFSVPRIRKDIVEYRSLRSGTHQPVAGEVYFGSKGIQAWTPTNGPTLGLHPPHAQPWNPQYVRPGGADYIVPVYVPDAIVPFRRTNALLLMGVG